MEKEGQGGEWQEEGDKQWIWISSGQVVLLLSFCEKIKDYVLSTVLWVPILVIQSEYES